MDYNNIFEHFVASFNNIWNASVIDKIHQMVFLWDFKLFHSQLLLAGRSQQFSDSQRWFECSKL